LLLGRLAAIIPGCEAKQKKANRILGWPFEFVSGVEGRNRNINNENSILLIWLNQELTTNDILYDLDAKSHIFVGKCIARRRSPSALIGTLRAEDLLLHHWGRNQKFDLDI